MPESGHVYFVVNEQSGTAFDLSGADQRSVIGFTFKESQNQKWRFVNHGDGWTIQNLYNEKYLDVDIPNVADDGVRVVALTTTNPRKWDVNQSGDGVRIVYQGTNKNVDLSDHGNAAPGTPVTLWSQWDGKNQVWKLLPTN